MTNARLDVALRSAADASKNVVVAAPIKKRRK